MDGANFTEADLGVEIVRMSATKSAEHPTVISACMLAKANFTGASARGLVTKDVELGKVIADARFLAQLKAPQPAR
jgi:hypothetical protein